MDVTNYINTVVQCELDAEGKYLSPHDLIYAQPVHIKPVGRPIPAVPVKGPPVSGPVYGPPRPVPLPTRYGPPPPLPPSRPFYPHKSPPVYEPTLEEKKPVVVVGGHQAGVQTHVHHHFHHDKAPLPVSGILEAGVIDTAPYPSAPSSSYGTPSFSPGPLYGNSIGPSGSGGLYSGSSSYGKPEFYKKQLNIKGSSSGKKYSVVSFFYNC